MYKENLILLFKFMSQTVKPPTLHMKCGSSEGKQSERSAELPGSAVHQDGWWPDAACLDTKLDLSANLISAQATCFPFSLAFYLLTTESGLILK